MMSFDFRQSICWKTYIHVHEWPWFTNMTQHERKQQNIIYHFFLCHRTSINWRQGFTADHQKSVLWSPLNVGQWQITVVDNWTVFNHNQKLVLHAKKNFAGNFILRLMEQIQYFVNILYICAKKIFLLSVFFLIHLQYSSYTF